MIEILADGVVKTFGRTRALDHVDLAVPSGALWGVVGADGAGKTTLFRCIAGLLRVDSGRVLPGRAGQARLASTRPGGDFWALIRELSADGTTVIVTTHVMAEAERCDRVALMAEGRVLACGPPASLRAATGTIVAVIEADPWQRAYAELAARWPGTTLQGTTIRVSLPAGADPRSLLAEALATVRVEPIHATDPSFEDAFIWFIRHSHPLWPGGP